VYRLFRKLMVFEHRSGMDAFAAELRKRCGGRLLQGTKMVSVDGGSINLEAGVEGHGEVR
jgi:hypothetical protein